ncbi:recombinase family protein [Kitasatospora purpeofusca]|uniref:recombinase family protein n=1 Tax=Kitasatospora purpeofusca TaxID=67352 RepID=UPI0035E29F0B
MQTLSQTSSPQQSLRAFLYARNSRGGKSVTAQMIENRRECEDRGWVNAGEFTDANRSASRYAKRKREDFDALVERVRAGEADVIITFESSRLQRDLEVYVQIRRLCIETKTLWCYGGYVYDMTIARDRQRTADDAVRSEAELDNIRERNLRTVRQNAASMRPHGRILTGYARRYDPTTGELVAQVPDEYWAPIIQRIFRDFASGMSTGRIARQLNAEGIRTSTGRHWRDTGIGTLLRRPSYAGLRVHQGEVIGEATWDAIIDEATWQATQAILADPSRQAMPSTDAAHLLVGIGRCGVCPGTLRCCPSTNGANIYQCRLGFCAAIQAAVLEAYVEERLLRWLALPTSAAAFMDPAHDAEAEKAIALVATLKAELEQARTAAREGTLSVGSLIAVESGILPRLAQAQAAVSAHTAASPLLLGLLGQDDVDERWNGLVLEQKRAVLRETTTLTLNPALHKGNGALYEGRIVMTLGPQKASQSSEAARASASSD